MKKLLLLTLFLGLAGHVSALDFILPQDLNGQFLTDVSMMGSLQAARTYSFEAGASTTGAVLYGNPAIFYGFCTSSVAAADQYIILRDTGSVVSSTASDLFGSAGVLLDISVEDQGMRCVTFPVPIRLEKGLWWQSGTDIAIGAKQVVTFFLLGI